MFDSMIGMVWLVLGAIVVSGVLLVRKWNSEEEQAGARQTDQILREIRDRARELTERLQREIDDVWRLGNAAGLPPEVMTNLLRLQRDAGWYRRAIEDIGMLRLADSRVERAIEDQYSRELEVEQAAAHQYDVVVDAMVEASRESHLGSSTKQSIERENDRVICSLRSVMNQENLVLGFLRGLAHAEALPRFQFMHISHTFSTCSGNVHNVLSTAERQYGNVIRALRQTTEEGGLSSETEDDISDYSRAVLCAIESAVDEDEERQKILSAHKKQNGSALEAVKAVQPIHSAPDKLQILIDRRGRAGDVLKLTVDRFEQIFQAMQTIVVNNGLEQKVIDASVEVRNRVLKLIQEIASECFLHPDSVAALVNTRNGAHGDELPQD